MKEAIPLLLSPDDLVVRVYLSSSDPGDTTNRLVAAKWGFDAIPAEIVATVTLLDVRALDDQERYIYARFMGIGCLAATFSEIGDELGVSREAANQMFARAANKTTRHNPPEATSVPV